MRIILNKIQYIGAMLTLFSRLALPEMGVSVRMLQWLDGAGGPPECFWISFDELKNLTNLGPMKLKAP